MYGTQLLSILCIQYNTLLVENIQDIEQKFFELFLPHNSNSVAEMCIYIIEHDIVSPHILFLLWWKISPHILYGGNDDGKFIE